MPTKIMNTILDLRHLAPPQRDAAVDEAVAMHVAKWEPKWLLMKRGFYYRPGAQGYTAIIAEAGRFDHADAERDVSSSHGEVSMIAETPPPFATSADAVLPLLPKTKGGDFWTVDAGYLGARACIRNSNGIKSEGAAPTLPLAACLALLRAHGVEVVI